MKLEAAAVQEGLKTLPGWESQGEAITKLYRFGEFKEAIAFVNRVADLAESADHHPDIEILFNKVKLTLSTHSAGGLTDKDLALAGQIEAVEHPTV